MNVQLSAQVALEQSEKTFAEIICFIENKRSEIQDLIRAQEKIAVSRAEGLLKRLEEEISELQRQDEELQQLSLTEDHIHFLQVFVFFQKTNLCNSPQLDVALFQGIYNKTQHMFFVFLFLALCISHCHTWIFWFTHHHC